MSARAQARSSGSLRPKNGALSTVEHSPVRMGRNRAVPVGTVHVRVTGSGEAVPVRNQTWREYWMMPQLAPRMGLEARGSPKTACHQAADHSAYDFPCA